MPVRSGRRRPFRALPTRPVRCLLDPGESRRSHDGRPGRTKSGGHPRVVLDRLDDHLQLHTDRPLLRRGCLFRGHRPVADQGRHDVPPRRRGSAIPPRRAGSQQAHSGPAVGDACRRAVGGMPDRPDDGPEHPDLHRDLYRDLYRVRPGAGRWGHLGPAPAPYRALRRPDASRCAPPVERSAPEAARHGGCGPEVLHPPPALRPRRPQGPGGSDAPRPR